jgi:membrane protease YdiL (CAAX protease family)
MIATASGEAQAPHTAFGYAADLALYLSIMFGVRFVHVPGLSSLVNGLLWSVTTLGVATWRMRARGVKWTDLGLCRPESWRKVAIVTVLILVAVPAAIIPFEIAKEWLPFELPPDLSEEAAVSRFGDLRGNWPLFASIIVLVWAQSMLEELLDRGFLITWFERALANRWFAVGLAVLLQAGIFGFRHSYDLSSRSITVGLIGLVMGVAYVSSGRNLWPLVLAHGLLNTLSMVDRVL